MSFPFTLGADPLAAGASAAVEEEAQPAGRTPSWNAYGSILAAVRAESEAAARQRPVACQCGEPLKTGPRGELYCPADGYQPRL